jgi:lipoate---protein ligase
MLIIENTSTNPYFNIAAEEYLLKESEEDIFMLYVDEPSVIVGKHQNTLAEVNFPYAASHKISIVRRISGGGTVYHDTGNLNFTFIANGKEGHLVDFRRFSQPVMDTLQGLGMDVKFEGKNDLRVNGLKISGNAEHVYKNRVLHHGTILVSSELKNLSEALRVEPGKYTDKAIKSIRSKVANLNDFMKQPISVAFLKEQIFANIRSHFNGTDSAFSDFQIAEINKLVFQKYSGWDWNFGYSPRYEFRKKISMKEIVSELTFIAEKGIIQDIRCEGFEILKKLNGARHRYEDIFQTLNDTEFQKSALKEWIWNLF